MIFLKVYKNIDSNDNYSKRLSTTKTRNIKNSINQKTMKRNEKVREKPISNSNNYKSPTEMEKLETLNIIDENKKLINKTRFIKIIKSILSATIFFII